KGVLVPTRVVQWEKQERVLRSTCQGWNRSRQRQEFWTPRVHNAATFGAHGSETAEFASSPGWNPQQGVRTIRVPQEILTVWYGGKKKMKEFCAEHAKDGIINIGGRRSGKQGFSKKPSEQKRREFCVKHAKDEMVPVNGTRYEHQGCTRGPSYTVWRRGKRPKSGLGMPSMKWLTSAARDADIKEGFTPLASFVVNGSKTK
ncbi:unnamed protein product, partial [Pylaiella littoralis]